MYTYIFFRVCAGAPDVVAFPMTFINNLFGTTSTEWKRDRKHHNLDVFQHNILIMPFESEGHKSLFVVVGAQNIKDYHKRNFKKSRPCILHVAPFQTSTPVQSHAYNVAHSKIRIWLNAMWRVSSGDNDLCSSPFTNRSIPMARPNGEYSMITVTMHQPLQIQSIQS